MRPMTSVTSFLVMRRTIPLGPDGTRAARAALCKTAHRPGRRGASHHDERLHAKPDRQLVPVIEIEECLENLLIDALGRLVSPHVLLPEDPADAAHGGGE